MGADATLGSLQRELSEQSHCVGHSCRKGLAVATRSRKALTSPAGGCIISCLRALRCKPVPPHAACLVVQNELKKGEPYEEILRRPHGAAGRLRAHCRSGRTRRRSAIRSTEQLRR